MSKENYTDNSSMTIVLAIIFVIALVTCDKSSDEYNGVHRSDPEMNVTKFD